MGVLEGEQRWPAQRPMAVRAAQKLGLGPTGPNAALVDWHRLHGASPLLAGDWPMVVGDPAANPFWPRSWHRGAAFAISAAFVEETLTEEPTALEAVAYVAGDHITAGLLPGGRHFGTLLDEKVVIGRTGRGTQVMAPVLIAPETSRLIIPPEVRLVHVGLAIGDAAVLRAVGDPPVV